MSITGYVSPYLHTDDEVIDVDTLRPEPVHYVDEHLPTITTRERVTS